MDSQIDVYVLWYPPLSNYFCMLSGMLRDCGPSRTHVPWHRRGGWLACCGAGCLWAWRTRNRKSRCSLVSSELNLLLLCWPQSIYIDYSSDSKSRSLNPSILVLLLCVICISSASNTAPQSHEGIVLGPHQVAALKSSCPRTINFIRSMKISLCQSVGTLPASTSLWYTYMCLTECE